MVELRIGRKWIQLKQVSGVRRFYTGIVTEIPHHRLFNAVAEPCQVRIDGKGQVRVSIHCSQMVSGMGSHIQFMI